MVSYLQVQNLTRSVGDKTLFSNLSFGVCEGQKVGLIAQNGTGKSTLLNILGGKDQADEGQVVFRNDLRIGYLEQTLSQLIADYRSEQHPVTAAQIRSDLFDCLAKVTVNYICVINPEVVVLRGGVMTSDFLEDLKEKILSYVPERCMPQLMIDTSEFSSIKGIVAACRQFISPSLDIVEDGSI